MKFCSKCGKEIMEEAVICVHCGCEVENRMQTSNNAKEVDEVNIGFCILSALIPLFGIIYWPLKHKETPKKAKACGITAIVSWVIYMILLLNTY